MNLFLYKRLGDFSFINQFIRNIYIYILIPILSFYLKLKFKNVVMIVTRHSVNEMSYFNAFLSDIDLTIVIRNNSSSKDLLKHFLLLKKILIMLDSPEIYSIDEFEQLSAIKNSAFWEVVYTFWTIRKINWNYKSLHDDRSELNQIKKNRSIEISLSKILSRKPSDSKVYSLKDFKSLIFINDQLPNTKIDDWQYLCSSFLETHLPNGIKIKLEKEHFTKINSLLPGEAAQGFLIELKKLITQYEILITKASIRLDEAMDVECNLKREWILKLEE